MRRVVSGLLLRLIAEKGSPREDTVGDVTSVPRGADELPNPHEMQTGLPLGVGVLNELDLRLRNKARHVGQRDEVVEVLAVVLEVEARVLEGGREVDERLSDFVDLLLGRDLRGQVRIALRPRLGDDGGEVEATYLHLDLAGVMWERNGKGHDSFIRVSPGGQVHSGDRE